METEEAIFFDLDEIFKDDFMKPQILLGDWALVEMGNGETVITPKGYEDTLDQDEIDSIEYGHCYGARLSAPGYLDCTDWSLYETFELAAESLIEMYS